MSNNNVKIFDGSELSAEARRKFPDLARTMDRLKALEEETGSTDSFTSGAVDLADASDFSPGMVVEWQRQGDKPQKGYGLVEEVDNELQVLTVLTLRLEGTKLVNDGGRRLKSVSAGLCRKSSKQLLGEPTGKQSGLQGGLRGDRNEPGSAYNASEVLDMAEGDETTAAGVRFRAEVDENAALRQQWEHDSRGGDLSDEPRIDEERVLDWFLRKVGRKR